MVVVPDTFLTAGNLLNVSQQMSMLGVVAFTTTIVMAIGDFDLSVGSMASLAGITAAVLSTFDQSVPVAVLAALSVGFADGLLNGFLVSYVGFCH
ncbi:MAG: ABC transporter permease, partial [Methylococcales bacterium]|nr:ABC transporter permease [Methylococcales bacterium]